MFSVNGMPEKFTEGRNIFFLLSSIHPTRRLHLHQTMKNARPGIFFLGTFFSGVDSRGTFFPGIFFSGTFDPRTSSSGVFFSAIFFRDSDPPDRCFHNRIDDKNYIYIFFRNGNG